MLLAETFKKQADDFNASDDAKFTKVVSLLEEEASFGRYAVEAALSDNLIERLETQGFEVCKKYKFSHDLWRVIISFKNAGTSDEKVRAERGT